MGCSTPSPATALLLACKSGRDYGTAVSERVTDVIIDGLRVAS